MNSNVAPPPPSTTLPARTCPVDRAPASSCLRTAAPVTPIYTPDPVLPPPEPPPCVPPSFPPNSLFDLTSRPISPTSVTIDLRANQELDSTLAQLPDLPSIMDSVTHVVCSPRVCGVHGDSSSITLHKNMSKAQKMVDGGSNICVTGDIGLLLDIVDVEPYAISVAPEGAPSSYDDCITKQGLSHSLLLMGQHTIKPVSTVPTWSKQSYHPWQSLLQAMYSCNGHRRASRIIHSLGVYASPVTTASSLCFSP